MGEMEMQFKGHAIVFVFVIASLGVSANAGRLSSVQLMSAHFDETKFPAKAAQFVSQREIHDHLFNTDAWSGYLIYRLNPSLKVYFDDRHDFYGEEFIKDYIKVINANEHWREPLDKARVQWILIPTSSSLSSLLTQDSNWRIEYDDGLAIIFARVRNTEK